MLRGPSVRASVRAIKRALGTNVIALSMMLLRHAPEGPAKAMSCVTRPEQGQATDGPVRDMSETYPGLHR